MKSKYERIIYQRKIRYFMYSIVKNTNIIFVRSVKNKIDFYIEIQFTKYTYDRIRLFYFFNYSRNIFLFSYGILYVSYIYIANSLAFYDIFYF